MDTSFVNSLADAVISQMTALRTVDDTITTEVDESSKRRRVTKEVFKFEDSLQGITPRQFLALHYNSDEHSDFEPYSAFRPSGLNESQRALLSPMRNMIALLAYVNEVVYDFLFDFPSVRAEEAEETRALLARPVLLLVGAI